MEAIDDHHPSHHPDRHTHLRAREAALLLGRSVCPQISENEIPKCQYVAAPASLRRVFAQPACFRPLFPGLSRQTRQ